VTAGQGGREPAVRVLHGNPDAEELAAITALLAVLVRRTVARTRSAAAAARPVWAGIERHPAPRRPSWKSTP